MRADLMAKERLAFSGTRRQKNSFANLLPRISPSIAQQVKKKKLQA
jgi:hypothetical protein